METQTAEQPTKKATKAKKTAPKKPTSRAVAVHRPAPPAAPPPSNMLQVIANAVADPRCDVAKMQALLDMQKQIEDRDAQKAFTRAFNALQAELPVITKDGRIDHGDKQDGKKRVKTSFATYPNINRVVGPLLKKHGFTFSTSMEPDASGAMVAVSTLSHVDGDSRKTQFRLTADTTGAKNNQQGWGSSQQYGMRYNMIALLNIVSEAKEDADNDGFAQKEDPPINQKQLAELIKLADDTKTDKVKFCALMDVESFAAIPQSRFAEARGVLNMKKRAQQASDFPGDRQG